MFRRFVKGFFWGIAVFIFILYGTLSTLPYEKFVRDSTIRFLNDKGINDVDFNIKELTFSKLFVADLKIGKKPDVFIKKITADYKAFESNKGQIESLGIDGLSANIYISGNKLSFGENDKIFSYIEENKKDKSDSSFLIKNIDLHNLKVKLNGSEDNYLYIKEANIKSSGQNGKFILEVKNFPLEYLSFLIAMEGFYLKGLVSGVVPVEYKDGKLYITEGKLESVSGGGIIKYKPVGGAIPFASDNENLKFVNNILENFNFETLQISFDGDVNNNITSKVSIFGSNPGVSEGKKVQLNIKLEGNIIGFIINSIKLYKNPEKYIE